MGKMENLSLFAPSVRELVADNDFICFSDYSEFADFVEEQTANDVWGRMNINAINVKPVDIDCYTEVSDMSNDFAITNTWKSGTGLVIMLEDGVMPLGDSAIKSLEDRAKISGNALTKVSKPVLADIINQCVAVQNGEATFLIRGGKCRAVHSGDEYVVLPMNALLYEVQQMLDIRFPGSSFSEAYTDQNRTVAKWTIPDQADELLGKYRKHVEESGKEIGNLVPAIRFESSDTGFASAKLDAMIDDILIGSCCSVDHRGSSTISDFADACNDVYAQFENCVARLESLLDIDLDYPVNAMTRVVKRLGLPKKAAVEAVAQFKEVKGEDPGTAHEVFCALQEILFLMEEDDVPQKKVMNVQEILSRALNLKWKDYDLPLPVNL